MNLFQNVVLNSLGWTLLHFLWQGAFIAIAFASLSIPLNRCSANSRYLLACGFFVMMACCPLVTWYSLQPSESTPTVRGFGSDRSVLFDGIAPSLSPSIPIGTPDIAPNTMGNSKSLTTKTIPTYWTTQKRESSWNRSLESAIPIVVFAWLCGVSILSLRMLLAWSHIARLRRFSTTPVNPLWMDRMTKLALRMCVSRPVQLVESAMVEVPTVIGWLKPMILVPTSALTGLTEVQLEAIFAHELAHIRRHDFIVNLAQSVIETLLFYHPAVWWLSKRIRDEREHCCDDLAVRLCDSRCEYVRALLQMESIRSSSSLALGVNGGSLLYRARRLLQPTRGIPHSANWFASLLGLGSVLFLLSLPCWISAGQVSQLEPGAPTPSSQQPQEEAGDRKIYTHPITVTGRAIDEAGKPISDAKIYLVSVRASTERLAETVSDAEGYYKFLDVPLPIEPAQVNTSDRDHGAFELLGSKVGKAFAWRPLKWYFPEGEKEKIDREMLFVEQPDRFFADEPIELDLKFGEPQKIQGRFVNESGEPLADVRIALGYCEVLQQDREIEHGGVNSSFQLTAFHQFSSFPEEFSMRRTDNDGRFEFAEMPAECQFEMRTKLTGYVSKTFYAATTDRALPMLGGSRKIYTDEIELTLIKPVAVTFQVVYGDTGLPAPNVHTCMTGWKTTDENGIAVLKLEPGTYKEQLLIPAVGTPYLETELDEEIVVDGEPNKMPIELRLKPACTINVTILDADTGEPIPDADLWMNRPDLPLWKSNGSGRFGVQFRSWKEPVVHFDKPRSSKEGKLRAFVEPGTFRFGVGDDFRPKGYDLGESDRVIDCPASKIIDVEFRLKRDANNERR